ncbi:MAG: class I SAM-dependent methyltransferase [bacterium]
MKAEVNKIRKHWQKQAQNRKSQENQVTCRDIWQRWLEVEMIKKYIKGAKRVLDVGCGNGYTTRQIAPLVSEVLGIDYSADMISRADKELKKSPSIKNISFKVADVTKLNKNELGTFNAAVSERCLINLASWEAQKKAIVNIASVIKKGGIFIFSEG